MPPYSGLGTMDQIVFPIRDHLEVNEIGSTMQWQQRIQLKPRSPVGEGLG